MFAKTASIVALLAAAASAVPTATTGGNLASRTNGERAITHTVVAGRAGLHFDPENVVAEVGDVIEWHYLPANHSVAQSSFGAPCRPLSSGEGFFSGFQPVASGQGPDVFQIVVQNSNPIWYYCAQTKGNHCQAGMSGVINQKFDTPNTLAAYKAAAALTGVSVVPEWIHPAENLIPNPNPLSGF
ncbi:plastocyanin-like domain-containing protein [Sporothrix schenckii 1099-18]|uniref:Phytocyanin domain-containing protein n=2 Tax=Sporothrix schenckii TaxID=29908 RepID=U7PN73_SPOS1|nr:plastocyanin-like domain-containing protein [Sporothrix schenckii 1099-18]ERS96199.1 hypothetical protein HMPREF1624_07108 [Sporothrix schenckii ATCC 58251]KJR86875.1 plastocyanin-like domain-containing protein [Sporothrix schenckii 1099-18]